MFLLIVFLVLAASIASFFPEWSWLTTLLVSLGCVLALRIVLAISGRSARTPAKTDGAA